MQLTLSTRSEQETLALGEALGRVLVPGDVVCLHGELGAGKTRLTRGIAHGAGADPGMVSSPTFIVMQEYPCAPAGALEVLVHVDAYRLRGADELETIGWDRIAADLSAKRRLALVVEWAARIEPALAGAGSSRLDVRLAHAEDPGQRVVTLEGDGTWGGRPGWSDVVSMARPATGGARVATRCPVTGEPVSPDSPTYPFSSERARLADLNRWLSGSYRLSREVGPDDEAEA